MVTTENKMVEKVDMEQVCQECSKKTKISKGPTRSFWHPRLKNLNRIEIHKSRSHAGLLQRFSLFCIELYEDFLLLYHAMDRFIFPRRNKIYGQPSPYHQVTGHLTFGTRKKESDSPVFNMHIELWARTIWGGYRKLSEGKSDFSGAFSLPYDLFYTHRFYIVKVWLAIYQTGYEHFNKKGQHLPNFTEFKRIKISKGDLVGIEYCCRQIQLSYWEYRQDTPLPRVVIKDHDKNAPDKYSPGYNKTLEKQFVPIELIKLRHMEMILLGQGLTYERITEDYPENLTVCMEKKIPGITRSDEWFGRRMMNGMYACDFDRDPKNQSLYWVHHHWGSYEKRYHHYAMPDVDMWFELKDNGLPIPVKITLTGPLTEQEKDLKQKRTFTPNDGAKWLAAKRICRVSAGLYAELAHHFAGTHVNTEQYAIACFRNLRLNPISGLLKSFLRSVVLVNHTADRILIGNGYITSACALTPKGIDQVVYNVLGTLDWKGFRPQQPISDAHTYAKASNLYWDIVFDFVTGFIDNPANRSEILAHWFEIHCFSEDLVNHSVPAFLCHYLQNVLLDGYGKMKGNGSTDWYQHHHRMDLTDERPEVNGVKKAVSRITHKKDGQEVTEADINQLKQACTYIIYQATFGHTWSNSKQYDDIGEVLYCSLGLRFGKGPDGVMGPESDHSIAPDLTRSTQMMWWSNMLSRTGYGFIMADEDGVVPPELRDSLEKHRQEFAVLDLDIDIIQSQTNI
ncbi:Lipoxygenase [Aquiflexum balticum DSM 16537]|uniref:Lipoxygenase n=1 Tax=Aquiflexum balticum DSM 16537 TaxID=758820 RepID=A0A1W2H1L5_9BACT|nr:lipoxygenase family protein [Aquiflexum balticum]SMD42835.1 Lipoxygenase [Aquiflexum balticum DSM 16537]